MSVPPTPEAGAKRSVRARLAGGPIARRIAKADLKIYRVVRSDLQIPPARRGVTLYTKTGEHAALWYAVGLVGAGADPLRRERWLRAMAAIFATQLANTGVKGIFRRPRPELEELPSLVKLPTSLSFPSAHSSTSFCAARGFAALVPAPVARVLYVAAAAMALSRVYCGVHYPSDIAVGAALGMTIGSAAR